jgi:hypothetical protein
MKNDHWEPGTTVELVALTLTVPGAIAALITLRIMLLRRRRINQGSFHADSSFAQR